MWIFWVVVGCSIAAALIPIYLARPAGRSSDGGPLEQWRTPIHYLSTGILVAIVWAIAFRSEVATLHISLKAVFILLLMEAIYLIAIRIQNPDWAVLAVIGLPAI